MDTNTPGSQLEDDSARTIRRLESQIQVLQNQLDDAEQKVDDLQIALAIAIEHGDCVEDELHNRIKKLHTEVRDRMIAERRLNKLVDLLDEKKNDLEVMVQLVIQHGDDIDAQWMKRYTESERIAKVDPLTQIGNRRHFHESLETAWRSGQRRNESLSLCLIDVDLFKQYNDHYGHPAGDDILKELAHTLNTHCRRPEDTCARVGGEEFCMILPHAEQAGAQEIAEAVREAVWKLNLPHKYSESGRVTISIGIASTQPSSEEDSAELYAKADEALYRAKQEGRNRVSV